MNDVKRVVMNEHFSANQGIQMFQDERALHLDFSLLDFEHAEFVKYGYRILDGVDSNLVDLGNNPHFVLNNLPEGKYRLEIVAFGDRGPITGSRMIIPLIVQIPFYEKKVFWVLVVGLFIFLLGALYVERLSRIQNLNDVGSILTKTAMDAELLYIQSDSSSPRLKNIAVNCRMALQGLRDLSWSLGQENTDGIHIKDRVNQFLLDIVKNTNISFKIESSENFNKRQFTLLERRQISMLIKESVTNAMKYSNLTHLYVHMDQKDNKVAIRMENDGYQESERMAGMGMANMRKRIKSLNGEMNVKILGDIYTIEFYYS
jgi:anti-sigma regulatory factor (Ser/Thr protein kinase)